VNKNDSMVPIKVFRFDPEVDKEPRFETYLVPLEGSVLDALRYIYENYDASLGYRFGCSGAGHQRCGACPVFVDGQPALSCKKMVEGGMTIEAHPKFEVIRDLALDFDRERKRTRKIIPNVKITVDPKKCDGCRDCISICPLKVFELRKDGTKRISVPADIESCCGLTCEQCSIFCKNSAIKIEVRMERKT
jgi:NAD-dependent dihydropyrimidine dehydrogenase PreA subunit